MIKKSFILFLISILINVFFNVSTASAIECPDSWKISQSPGNVSVISNSPLPSDLVSRIPEARFQELSKAISQGQEFLLIRDYNLPVPSSYFEKYKSYGTQLVIQSGWKVSTNGKDWKGLVATHPGNLKEYYEPQLSVPVIAYNDPLTFSRVQGFDRYFNLTQSSRFGLTPGKILAVEIIINVNGCKPLTVYERKSVIPNYKIETKSIEDLINQYYLSNPQVQQINFLSKESCISSLNSFVNHIKEVSSKSRKWSISNTKRGVLDLAWSLTTPENSVCYQGAASSNFPFFDIQLNPSKGDSCLTRDNPYQSLHNYTTNFYPCEVSVDSSGFEVAKFLITQPTSGQQNKTLIKIVCVKGTVIKNISGLNPKCPAGYKKK